MNEITVLQGAEPFYAENGKVGVLVSHGYTGSPQSMRYLAEGLAQAGFTVALPLLKGHGTTSIDMATATVSDWIGDVEEAAAWLKKRCDILFMVGLSMGGTLTLFMAGQHPDWFKGIIPINAILSANNPDLASLAYMRGAPSEVQGVGGDIKAPGVAELAYPVVPVATVKELFALMKVTEELLPRITCPALIIASREDHIVPPINADTILQRLPGTNKQILWLENSYHVATLDNDKDIIVQRSIEFIHAHA